MKKGRMIYTPASIIDVVNDIQKKKGYKKRSRAFDDAAKYARVGIEAERIYKLDFGSIFGKKIKKRKS